MDRIDRDGLKEMLERLHDKYNVPSFIENDPISIPHSFTDLRDQEIGGFLAATIAWGNRKAIVGNARRLMTMLDGAPYDFTMNASESEMATLNNFVHRTFNGGDCMDFIVALRRLYSEYGSMKDFFEGSYAESGDMRQVLSEFRNYFWQCGHQSRAEKHLSSIDKGAACKRLNMYIKWMVRKDDRGVDLGLWPGIPSSALYLPLDVHTASMGRELGLLTRKQNDWKAVEEITASLREFDPNDPVRYDFSLFGAGIDGWLKDKKAPAKRK